MDVERPLARRAVCHLDLAHAGEDVGQLRQELADVAQPAHRALHVARRLPLRPEDGLERGGARGVEAVHLEAQRQRARRVERVYHQPLAALDALRVDGGRGVGALAARGEARADGEQVVEDEGRVQRDGDRLAVLPQLAAVRARRAQLLTALLGAPHLIELEVGVDVKLGERRAGAERLAPAVAARHDLLLAREGAGARGELEQRPLARP
eukprot:5323780-Prymnesium_polylepis.1